MNDKKIGVSLTKIIYTGELLAMNIKRAINVVRNKKTLEAVDKVARKINNFYEDVNSVVLSSENRRKVIDIFKTVRPSLDDLNEIQENILSAQSDVKVSPSF